MKKDNILIIIITLMVISVLMLLLKDYALIPVHYNMYGDIDAYASKNIVILLGILPIAIAFLMDFVKKVDPNSAKYEMFLKYFKILKYTLSLFMELIVVGVVIGIVFPINVVTYFGVIIGGLFIVIGYILPKIKQNYFIGIKTPWTLKNEIVWDKTHFISGKLFIIWGIVFLIISIFNKYTLSVIMLIIIIVIIVFLYYYSYKQYCKIQKVK